MVLHGNGMGVPCISSQCHGFSLGVCPWHAMIQNIGIGMVLAHDIAMERHTTVPWCHETTNGNRVVNPWPYQCSAEHCLDIALVYAWCRHGLQWYCRNSSWHRRDNPQHGHGNQRRCGGNCDGMCMPFRLQTMAMFWRAMEVHAHTRTSHEGSYHAVPLRSMSISWRATKVNDITTAMPWGLLDHSNTRS